jgi:hypothetical protein
MDSQKSSENEEWGKLRGERENPAVNSNTELITENKGILQRVNLVTISMLNIPQTLSSKSIFADK